MNKAADHGLAFKTDVKVDGNINACAIHDSFAAMAHGIYKLLHAGKPYLRLIGADPLGTGDAFRTTIDATVFERWRTDADYRPRNLAEWAKRESLNPAAVASTVRADTGERVQPWISAESAPRTTPILRRHLQGLRVIRHLVERNASLP